MMKHMQKTVCALAVLATTSLPVMAESVDVRVIGTITPAACTPELTGGGTIDYGAINPASLATDGYTALEEKQLDFSINCDAPAKVAIRAINGRPGTLAGATETATGAAGAPAGVSLFETAGVYAVGLGLDGSDKIGGYGIRIAQGTVTADGEEVDNITRQNASASWSNSSAGKGILYSNTAREISWGELGTAIPIAFERLSGKLGVQAYINHASELDLTKPVALDGLTTIELVYL